MTKDEAAEAIARELRLDAYQECGYKQEQLPSFVIKDFNSRLKYAADKGWTQHGEELMKMAKSKAQYIDLDDLNGEFIKLSDLEAIAEALK